MELASVDGHGLRAYATVLFVEATRVRGPGSCVPLRSACCETIFAPAYLVCGTIDCPGGRWTRRKESPKAAGCASSHF